MLIMSTSNINAFSSSRHNNRFSRQDHVANTPWFHRSQRLATPRDQFQVYTKHISLINVMTLAIILLSTPGLSTSRANMFDPALVLWLHAVATGLTWCRLTNASCKEPSKDPVKIKQSYNYYQTRTKNDPATRCASSRKTRLTAVSALTKSGTASFVI